MLSDPLREVKVAQLTKCDVTTVCCIMITYCDGTQASVMSQSYECNCLMSHHVFTWYSTIVTMFPCLFLPCSVNITVKVAPKNTNHSTAGVTCSTWYEDATSSADYF